MGMYRMLFRDLLVAGTSFALDVALFAAFLWATQNILAATVMARLLSSVYNFAGNRYFVFRGRHVHAVGSQLLGYVVLVLVFMLASAHLVQWGVRVGSWPAVPVKIAVDVSLYVLSFALRKFWLFRVKRP